MSAACSTGDRRANPRRAGLVTRFTQTGSTNFSIIKKFKEMYDKPSAVFADWLRVSERTAKRKFAGQRQLSVEEVGKLIRSERGFEFVTAIMADYRPEWWRLCAPLMEAADIRKMQMAVQKRVTQILGDAIDADQYLSASIAQADALAIHGSEQARVHADALRTVGRPSMGRAVAAKAQRMRLPKT